MNHIDPERLRELLIYDPETGIFTWRNTHRGWIIAGKRAGGLDAEGYARIRLDGALHYSHRLAWLYVYDEWPDAAIDHINTDTADNRIENLRLATPAENLQNQRRGRGTSRRLGVSWDTTQGRWQSQIQVNGKKMHLGRFKAEEAAYAAYVTAKRRLHEFGTL